MPFHTSIMVLSILLNLTLDGNMHSMQAQKNATRIGYKKTIKRVENEIIYKQDSTSSPL